MGTNKIKSNSNRIAYLDELKGFVILCVVLGHVLDGYISGSYWPECEDVLTVIFNVIYSFHMPLCFILSGYFFRLAYVKEGRINRKKLFMHTADFVIVYILFSLIFWGGKMLMSSYVNSELSFSSIFYIWRTPLPSFWYLYVLIAYYIIFSVMWWKKCSPGVMFIVLIVISLASTLLPSGIWFQVQRILYYAPFFYLGIYMREKPDAFFMKKKFCGIAGALSVIASIVLAILGDKIITIPLLNLAVAFGISILLWKMFKTLSHPNRGGYLRLYGENMLEIYVTHILLAAAVRAVLQKIGINIPVICIVLNTAISGTVPMIVSIILKKCRVHDFIFKTLSTCVRIKSEHAKTIEKQ